MSNIIKNIGNIKQFGKEEIFNGISVLGIGYFGSCISLLCNLPDENLDTLLPDDIHMPPYANTNNPSGMLNYLFSLQSGFPHHITTKLDFLDEYLLFYGGISGYIFSSYRFALKYLFKSIDTKNTLIDILSFYLLPIVISYFVLFPFGLPIISGIMSMIPCIYQEGIGIDALLLSFSCITNWFDGELIRNLFDIKQFPMNFIYWIGNGWLGIFASFFVFVVIGMTCFSSWMYIASLWFLLPIYLKITLGISFSDLGKTISSEIKNHILGLITLFSFYTISSAYTFLNSQVALGIAIGSISILCILFYSTFKIYFELGFLHGLSQLFSKLDIGPAIFWLIIIGIVFYKYTSTQTSLSTIY